MGQNLVEADMPHDINHADDEFSDSQREAQ